MPLCLLRPPTLPCISYKDIQGSVICAHNVRKFTFNINRAQWAGLSHILQHGFWASAHPFLSTYLQHISPTLPPCNAAGSLPRPWRFFSLLVPAVRFFSFDVYISHQFISISDLYIAFIWLLAHLSIKLLSSSHCFSLPCQLKSLPLPDPASQVFPSSYRSLGQSRTFCSSCHLHCFLSPAVRHPHNFSSNPSLTPIISTHLRCLVDTLPSTSIVGWNFTWVAFSWVEFSWNPPIISTHLRCLVDLFHNL